MENIPAKRPIYIKIILALILVHILLGIYSIIVLANFIVICSSLLNIILFSIFEFKLYFRRKWIIGWMNFAFASEIFSLALIYSGVYLFIYVGEYSIGGLTNFIVPDYFNLGFLFILPFWVLFYVLVRKYVREKVVLADDDSKKLTFEKSSSIYDLKRLQVYPALFIINILISVVCFIILKWMICGSRCEMFEGLGIIFYFGVFSIVLLIANVRFIQIYEKKNKCIKGYHYMLVVFIIVTLLIPVVFFLFGPIIDEKIQDIDIKVSEKRNNEIEEYVAPVDDYISKNDLQGCIDYVSTHKSPKDTNFDAEWCYDKLEWYQEDLVVKTKNISVCTTDLCFWKYALIINDSFPCILINGSRQMWGSSMQMACMQSIAEQRK